MLFYAMSHGEFDFKFWDLMSKICFLVVNIIQLYGNSEL